MGISVKRSGSLVGICVKMLPSVGVSCPWVDSGVGAGVVPDGVSVGINVDVADGISVVATGDSTGVSVGC